MKACDVESGTSDNFQANVTIGLTATGEGSSPNFNVSYGY
jgi:hypothetical protein